MRLMSFSRPRHRKPGLIADGALSLCSFPAVWLWTTRCFPVLSNRPFKSTLEQLASVGGGYQQKAPIGAAPPHRLGDAPHAAAERTIVTLVRDATIRNHVSSLPAAFPGLALGARARARLKGLHKNAPQPPQEPRSPAPSSRAAPSSGTAVTERSAPYGLESWA